MPDHINSNELKMRDDWRLCRCLHFFRAVFSVTMTLAFRFGLSHVNEMSVHPTQMER